MGLPAVELLALTSKEELTSVSLELEGEYIKFVYEGKACFMVHIRDLKLVAEYFAKVVGLDEKEKESG